MIKPGDVVSARLGPGLADRFNTALKATGYKHGELLLEAVAHGLAPAVREILNQQRVAARQFMVDSMKNETETIISRVRR